MDERERAFEWLSNFKKRVLAVLDGMEQIVPIDDVIVEWPEVGWHVFVGRLRTESRPSFSLWLDTYLGKDDSLHLGCWYSTSPRLIGALQAELARVWQVHQVPVYDHQHRAQEHLRADVGRAEVTRIGAPLIDRWYGRNETYAGLYVFPAPLLAQHVDQVLDKTIGAFRQLSDAVRVVRGEQSAVSGASVDWPAVRERVLREVLVRSAQSRLRRDALAHHVTCVVTGERHPIVLEAAHIKAVKDYGADSIDNILLLRADLHTLFDAGLLTISRYPRPHVRVARALRDLSPAYSAITTLTGEGKTITGRQWAALEQRNRDWNDEFGVFGHPTPRLLPVGACVGQPGTT